MGNYKFTSFLLILLFLISGVFAADTYNQKGDFTVTVNSLKSTVFNDDIKNTFQIEITNNLNSKQYIELDIPEENGWDLSIEDTNFYLAAKESISLNFNVEANENFDYGASVVSPDFFKISQENNYEGSTVFPVIIMGSDENVSIKFTLNVEKKDNKEVYNAQFGTEQVSPIVPLGYTIQAKNLNEVQTVEIVLEFGENKYEFEDTFSAQNNFKVYQQEIDSSIEPGNYDAQITIRLVKSEGVVWEWTANRELEVAEYEKLEIIEDFKKGLFKDTYTIQVTNLGNIIQTFEKGLNVSLFNKLFFDSDNNYEKTEEGIIFIEDLNKGETKNIEFAFNYIPLYVILFVIVVIISYIYIRKASNPLDVETKIYEIKKVTHEGVKSMKIRIGFENIKEHHIDSISVIFRMPSYLSVKEDSFLLTEPNHVLKGKNQYKLIWDFKKFEENDSRILGFALINTRGILGDIKIPDLEFEVKVNGKIKKYTHSFPIIKG